MDEDAEHEHKPVVPFDDQPWYRRAAYAVVYNPIAVVLVLLFVAVVALLILLQSARAESQHLQEQGDALEAQNDQLLNIAQDTNSLADFIKSCTDPDGKCAKEQQANQAALVGSLNEYNLWAAWCAQRPGSENPDTFVSCVEDKLVPTEPGD